MKRIKIDKPSKEAYNKMIKAIEIGESLLGPTKEKKMNKTGLDKAIGIGSDIIDQLQSRTKRRT